MNIASATATSQARAESPQTATSRQMCQTIEALRGSRSTSAPSTGTDTAARTISHSATGRLVPVTHAPHGEDPLRLGRVGLDFLPQPPHVHRHRGLVAERPA